MLSCAFCGKSQREVSRLLAGMDSVHICDKCVDLSHTVLEQERKKTADADRKKALREIFVTPTPREIHQHLNQHIIGQEQVKKGVSVAVYNHCKRVFNNTDVPVQKSNVLLLGPTGVGKTLIAQTLAEILGVPFVITDATVITESGYAGDDAEVLIHKLLQASDYDAERAEIGIIYVDEIDKKAKRNDLVSLSRDVSGEGVQQSLLKLMEGTVVKVPNKPGHHPETLDISTSNILFIVGGAFVGLDRLVKQRVGKNRIGFGSLDQNESEVPWEQYLETADLISYGLIPEFIGRLPSIGILHELSSADLVRVLTEPKYSLVKQYQALFSLDKIKLEFNIDSIEAIVDIAVKQKLGARGLRKILDNILLETQYQLPELAADGVTNVIITAEAVHGEKPLMIKGIKN
jgi:ATP-dependent Clp protease ATP-binding subunit ClpX